MADDRVFLDQRVFLPRLAIAGVLAAGAALATGELIAAIIGSDTSPVTAVGTVFIDEFAASLKDLAIRLFGTNDKVALITGVVVVSLVIGALLGLASARRRWILPVGIVVFGAVGAWAIATDPLGSWRDALAITVPTTVAGVAVAVLLLRLVPRPVSEPVTEPTSELVAPGPIGQPGFDPTIKAPDRRAFLVAAGGVAAGSLVVVGLARRLQPSTSAGSVEAIALPRPQRTTPLPASTAPTTPGLTPYITPTSDFYRIDTALRVPQIDASNWSLTVRGLVERELTVSYDELLAMESVSVPVTIQCVSNEVGGGLVGTAVWQGVPLADLLERAGVTAGAEQVVGRSTDGFTAGFPVADAGDGRTAIVAYAMNGEPLPARHGFPARLVVAGLYGYVSATKWLEAIELTEWDAFDGYWIPRGWSKLGPIKTTSRIDVPSSSVDAGDVVIAGVAWAPTRGIQLVEVQVDDGEWIECDLAASATEETWVQWRTRWPATPGRHRVRVRATDGDGVVQTEDTAPPAPDGATGYHTRTIDVR